MSLVFSSKNIRLPTETLVGQVEALRQGLLGPNQDDQSEYELQDEEERDHFNRYPNVSLSLTELASERSNQGSFLEPKRT